MLFGIDNSTKALVKYCHLVVKVLFFRGHFIVSLAQKAHHIDPIGGSQQFLVFTLFVLNSHEKVSHNYII